MSRTSKSAWLLIGVISLDLLAQAASAGVVTFENFSEGQAFSSTFTDPATGVVFYDSTTNVFGIEYGAADPLFPGVLPGHFLVGGGFVPGNGTGFVVGFGFTARFPLPVDHASIDVLYRTVDQSFGSTITAQALTQADKVIETKTFTLSSPVVGGVTSFDFQTPVDEIMSLKLTAPNFGTGYDNIAFSSQAAPLPPALPCAAVTIIATIVARWTVARFRSIPTVSSYFVSRRSWWKR